MTDSAKFQMV